jgi:mRNA interferase MazF
MDINQGDLVLLPIPFTDQSGNKVRPALVISSVNFHKKCNDFLILPITSVLKEVDYSLLLKQMDLKEGKLIVTSRIRIDKLVSVDKKLIIKKIGVVEDTYLSSLLKIVKTCFYGE